MALFGSSKDLYKLAYLGDAVLDLILRESILEEGVDLSVASRERSVLASSRVLAEAARRCGLTQGAQGPLSDHTLASFYEAVLGALYADQGLDAAREFVRKSLLAYREELLARHFDYKSALQQYFHKKGHRAWYEVEEEAGPPHRRTYRVVLVVEGQPVARGTGRSKKEAERNAAREYYLRLRKEGKVSGVEAEGG